MLPPRFLRNIRFENGALKWFRPLRATRDYFAQNDQLWRIPDWWPILVRDLTEALAAWQGGGGGATPSSMAGSPDDEIMSPPYHVIPDPADLQAVASVAAAASAAAVAQLPVLPSQDYFVEWAFEEYGWWRAMHQYLVDALEEYWPGGGTLELPVRDESGNAIPGATYEMDLHEMVQVRIQDGVRVGRVRNIRRILVTAE